MSSIAPIFTALFVLLCNALFIYLFKKNDDELKEKINEKSLYKMYALSFVAGFVIGFLPDPLNSILIVPTVVVFIAAETDMVMQQIYSITCIVCATVGIGFIYSYNYGAKNYFIHVVICGLLLLVFRAIKALNTGDVELIFSLTPYLYIASMEFSRPTFIESFLFFLAGTCVFSLVMNFKKYIKDKITSFPFAVPTCVCYCSYFFFLNVIYYVR